MMAMQYQFIGKTWWLVCLMCLISVQSLADDNTDPLAQLANASSFPTSSIETAGSRNPNTVAQLYLTVPETSHVIINRNRTRATGRDRYFEVPIDYRYDGKLEPTLVEVMQLIHHGAGQPEASGYQKYELSLIPGTTTYFTAKPEKKKQEEAMDFTTLTALMPQTAATVDTTPEPSNAHNSQSCCPQKYNAAITVRYKDAGVEIERKARTTRWLAENPKIQFQHNVAFNQKNDAVTEVVSLKYQLYRISGDIQTTGPVKHGPEQLVNIKAVFRGDIAEIDVAEVLESSIRETLLLTHNAEKIVAKDWVLIFKQPGRQHIIEFDGLSYEIKVLVNHE